MKQSVAAIFLIIFIVGCQNSSESFESDQVWNIGQEQSLYKAPPAGTHTRWVSPENPTGEKSLGGTTNHGAKGNAFFIIAPGEKKILMDYSGAGIINRMWMSGTVAVSAEQRRMVRLDMFWEHEEKPAVSVPIGDFFGAGLGRLTAFESELFSSPEGRSFNMTIPMPFRKHARVEVSNDSPHFVLMWYDINFTTVKKLPKDILYFHAFWDRQEKTELGIDYEILPKVNGLGRYVGAHIGVIGDSAYRGTWFGEGEVKVYLDGDNELPTLVGTGTEDYVGSGFGQGRYDGRYFGSLVSDNQNDLYAFYRYHIVDPVYFHQDCRVTIQQMGNCSVNKYAELEAAGAATKLVALLDLHSAPNLTTITDPAPEYLRLLDMETEPSREGKSGTYFYRSDDVCATAYFYLDKPTSNLPDLPSAEKRIKKMKEKVFSK